VSRGRKRQVKNSLSPIQTAFINHCREDFRFFCLEVLKIVDKKARLVPFEWNEPQEIIWRDIQNGRNRLGVLKARQEGVTTFVAAYFFWKVLLNENERAIVLAHENDAAARIFTIYKNYYECLPDWMKNYFPTKHSTKTELVFRKHTGNIRIATANTPDKLRGTTLHYLHCSEMAFWDKPHLVFTTIMQSLTDRGAAFVETTANSFNQFYDWWMTNRGYHKVFLPWFALESYRIDKDKTGYLDHEGVPLKLDDQVQAIVERELDDFEQKYAAEHKLDNGQIRWLKWALSQKCDDEWDRFSQEYPATPQDAFLHSGDMFFDGEWIPEEVDKTIDYIEEPLPGNVYVMGVDTASGSSEGDFSAACVINATDTDNMRIAAWIYERLPIHEFANKVIELGKKYGQALAVVEVNNVGAALQEELSIEQYPHLYRRFVYDKMAERYIEKLGFYTSSSNRSILTTRLRKMVAKERLTKLPQVLINEISTFTYNDKGEGQHSPGCHDDMIFATCLALEGLEQLIPVREKVITDFVPKTHADYIKFEMSTGLDARTKKPLTDHWQTNNHDHLLGDGLDF